MSTELTFTGERKSSVNCLNEIAFGSGAGGGGGGGGAVTQSGTWTVQPGNTANTTAWKVDGSAVTQPVSLASVPSHAVTNAGITSIDGKMVAGSGATTAGTQRVVLATDSPGITTLGQAAMSASTPVVIASDQSAVPVTGTGTALAPSALVVTTQRPAVTQVISTALEASHVLKASAGQLVELSIFNSKASAQFILILNSATLTADGAVTLLYPPIPIAAATLLVLDFPSPVVASTGIVVCNSSTGSFTKTLGSADCAFYAQVN